MMGLINFIQKRPSDKTIRIGRIVFGLVFSLAIYYNLIYLGKDISNEYLFGLFTIDEQKKIIVKYVIASLGLIPIIMGATNICLLKTKYMRIVQIIFGVLLFYISSCISSSPNLDVDFLVGLMGILPLVAGITGKCITSNCLKYKEKITKIRV